MRNIVSFLLNLGKHYHHLLFHSKDPLSDGSLEPLFYTASPQTIKYAPSVAELHNYIEVPITTFEKYFDLRWTSGLLLRPHQRDAIWLDTAYPKQVWIQLEERLHHPLESLVICKINETIGHGLFVAPDADPLPTGTIIGLYSGQVTDTIDIVPNPYVMLMNSERVSQTSLQHLLNITYVSALKSGNFTRFIIDFPSKNELENSQLETQLLSEIASENVHLHSTTFYGAPISVFFTARTIMPGEQLGFSYRGSYWNSVDITRCVMNIKSEIIGHFEKNRIILNSSLASSDNINPHPVEPDGGITDENATNDNGRMTEEFEKIAHLAESILSDPSDDDIHRGNRLISNINFTLKVFMDRFSHYSKEGHLIKNLQAIFNSDSKTLNEKLNMLETSLNTNKTKRLLQKKQLLPLKIELNYHIKKYYEMRNPH